MNSIKTIIVFTGSPFRLSSPSRTLMRAVSPSALCANGNVLRN